MTSVELSRQKLELNMEQLRRSLQHWRASELEYEELREEIETLRPNATREDMLEIGSTLDGNALAGKEITNLLGPPQSQRSQDQVVSLISRRIEYVQRNIMSVSRQLARLEGGTVDEPIATKHNGGEEEGLPLTEIFEELDDKGNVVSSQVSHPGDVTPEIIHSLEKAGVHQNNDVELKEHDQKKSGYETNANEVSRARSVSNAGSESSNGRKKSVAFATGTKEESIEEKSGPTKFVRSFQGAPSAQSRIAELAKGSFSDSERVIEVGEDDRPIGVKGPEITKEDSLEDASLRREMLNYTMNEIGSVVAEIDLEEEDDDSESDGFEHFSETSSDAEDEHGMSRTQGIGGKYRREMLELENNLNSRMLHNAGPNLEDGMKGPNSVGDHGKISFSQDHEVAQDTRSKAKSKEKEVRFAEDVDIAPMNESKRSQSPNGFANGNGSDFVIQDSVAENTTATASNALPGQANRKVSRFKRARSTQTPSSHTGNASSSQTQDNLTVQGAPLGDRIIER